MIKHVISLANGTEISSGSAQASAYIKNLEITRTVNRDEEITVGSVCAAEMSATLITPHGSLNVNFVDGAAIRVYSIDDNGVRKNDGLFVLQKPTRTSANTYKLVAYDNISKLDVDIAAWINGLTGWPYTLKTFAQMVCTKCGVTFVNDSIPNGNAILIQKITIEAVTGRQLMQYMAEMCGMFCRATRTGGIQFGWYTLRNDISIAPSTGTNVIPYYSNSLNYEDYQVAPIERVVIYNADGTSISKYDSSYSGDPEELNTYTVPNNPILTAISAAHLTLVANTIYSALSAFTYTPCTVDLFSDSDIDAGDIVNVTDVNDVTIQTVVMTVGIKGRVRIESSGSADRRSPAVINSSSYQQLAKQLTSDELLRTQLLEALYEEIKDDIVCKFG